MANQVGFPISENESNYIDNFVGVAMPLIELLMRVFAKNNEMEFFLTCLMTCIAVCAFSSSFYRACRAFDAGFKPQDKASIVATVLTVLLCSLEYFRHVVPMAAFCNATFSAVAMVLAFGVSLASLVAFYFRKAQISLTKQKLP